MAALWKKAIKPLSILRSKIKIGSHRDFDRYVNEMIEMAQKTHHLLKNKLR